ncbi:MAG: YfhO family protein [Eubacterium sp.]|nr:YfhO family protein [Eubacterium sp.]
MVSKKKQMTGMDKRLTSFGEQINTSINKKNVRTVRCIAFFLPVLTVLIAMILGSFAPFGGKDVMTAGGMTDHLTYYYELHDKVHGGEGLIYSLTSGMGYDFSTIFTYYLSDPLNLIILLFPRTAILAVLNLLYMVKIGLAGLFMSIFLTRRKERILARRKTMEERRVDVISAIKKKEEIKEKKAEKSGRKELILGGSEEPKSRVGAFFAALDIPNLGFSAAFALSAYMIGQGLDVSHLSVVVLFPLILMELDNLLENGDWKKYAILMTVSVFCSFYMTIVVFIFTIVYIAAFEYGDLSQAIHRLLLKLLADVLAIGAGAVIIINSVSGVFFQKEISIKFPMNAVSTTIFDVVKAQMPTTPPSSTLIYGYGIDIFCGTATLLLLILYLLNPNISLRRKISQSAVFCVLTAGLILVTPNYLFNGFFASGANVCVFGFLFVFQLLSMAYEAFLNLDHNPSWQIHIGTLLIFILAIVSTFMCDRFDSMKPFVVGLELVIAYYILLLLYRGGSMTRWLFVMLFPIVLVGELTYSFVNGFNVLGSKAEEYYESADYRYYETAASLHRSEPDARILYYDPKTSMSTPVSNTLCGYDYIVTAENTNQVDSMLEFLRVENGMAIYRNPYSVHGFFLPKNVITWVYDQEHPFSSINLLVKNVVGSDPMFRSVEGEFMMAAQSVLDDKKKERIRETYYAYIYSTKDEGDLYGSTENITHFGFVQPSGEANVFRRHWDREKISYSPTVEYATFDQEAFLSFNTKLVPADWKQNDTSDYIFEISAPEDGYLIIPVTPGSGWTAEEYSLFSKEFPGEEMMMVPVSAGENTVHLTYSPMVLYIGLIVSVIFIAFLIVLCASKREKATGTTRFIVRSGGFIQENYVYFLTFGILTMVFLFALCATSSFPFGDRSPLVGDGYEQSYNGYVRLVHSVKNGSFSMLNWNTGVAIDGYNGFASYLTSPWHLLKFYLLPESMIFFEYIFSRYLYFVVPGLCMILYLTKRRKGATMEKSDWRLVVLGTTYGLSSYAVGFFLYNGFGFLRILPLILLGMERLIYDKKPFLYIGMLYLFMGDAYYAFMLCEFIFLYFFTMEFESIKDMFFKGVRILIASLTAVGLACYQLIPYFFRTLASPYKSTDTVSPVAREGGSYLSVFSETMSVRPPTIISQNDYDANIYVGILILICIPLYLMSRKTVLSVRIRRLLLVILLFAGFGNGILNYIFHGMHYQSLVPNRFAAFYVFLLVIMFYDCLMEWRDYKGKTFAIGIGGSILVCAVLWTAAFLTKSDLKAGMGTEESAISYGISIFLLVLYLTFALLQLLKKYRNIFRNAMIAILLLEVIISALVTFKYSVGQEIRYTKDSSFINTLSARNPDMSKDFHATEYIESELYNMAEVTDTTSISAFSSMMSMEHLDLVRKWGLITSNNVIYYYSGNPIADMMLHIQYHITGDENEKSISSYPVTDREGTLTLHKNPWYLPVGLYIPNSEVIQRWDDEGYKAYGSSGFDYQNAFSEYLGCGKIYEEIEPEPDESKITDENRDSVTYVLLDPSDFEAGISNQVHARVHLAKDVEGDIYVCYHSTVMYIGSAIRGKAQEFDATMYLPQTADEYPIQIAVLNHEEMNRLHDKLAQYTMDDAIIDGSSLEGTIMVPEDGMIYLSIPNMSEWTIMVDGNETKAESFLGGVGISVKAGTHSVRVSFKPHGMWIGIGISVGIFTLLILYVLITKSRNKKKLCMIEEES